MIDRVYNVSGTMSTLVKHFGPPTEWHIYEYKDKSKGTVLAGEGPDGTKHILVQGTKAMVVMVSIALLSLYEQFSKDDDGVEEEPKVLH